MVEALQVLLVLQEQVVAEVLNLENPLVKLEEVELQILVVEQVVIDHLQTALVVIREDLV